MARRPGWRWLCLVLLASPIAAASVGVLSLDIAHIDHPAFEVRDLQVRFPADGQVRVAVSQLRIGEERWRDLKLACAAGGLEGSTIRCDRGELSVNGRTQALRVGFDFDLAGRSGKLSLRGSDFGALQARLAADGSVHAEVEGLQLAAVRDWAPAVAAWSPSGRFDGWGDWKPGRSLALVGRIAAAGFGLADGLQAGEALGAEFELSASAKGPLWDWTSSLAWSAGAVYLHPVYLESGPRFRAHGRLLGTRLDVSEASIELEGVEQLAASAVIDLATGRVEQAAVALAKADLAVIGPQWISAVVAPAAAGRIRYAGSVSGAMEFVAGRLVALDAVFDDAGFNLLGADGGGDLAFGPLSGHVPWRETGAARAELSIGGGRWQKLALGAFRVEAEVEPTRVDVGRFSIPVLDGALVVDGLGLRRSEDGWWGSGSVVVEPVSMSLLTEALGLPSMAGVLAASMPALRVSPGEIALDGALVISVFDGYVQATGLRLQEPFGVASHLTGDIEARHLDLAQLTETFSFGSITGFVDADLLGLELVRWRPVRFDARLASSAGRYPRRISQRAVQNISSLGGAGAVAAVQRSLLGFFETFGYRELGLRCVLRGDVCVMSGIDGDAGEGGFTIVRGGGIPALDVIGYNRRVDWRELIERLERVIADNVAPELR